jgi:tetratricopeptide (TPR) repeat protein
MFKHALTQEIVYNGLLKKQRREIHEQIAQVMENVFQDRLSELYETLAFHFARGQSTTKAVDYLVKAGEKSLARYAVEEAHEYFKEAYDILALKEEMSEEDKIILIDILNSWGYAYYYLGEINEFVDLFSTHQIMVESLGDKASSGMFYAWFGIANFMAGRSKDAYECLRKSLELGEKSGNQKVIGYACTWLTWTCAELGRFSEGIDFGDKAQKIALSFPSDQYIFFKSLSGLCYINFLKGDTNRIFEGAKRLIEYGERNANSRCKVFAHWMKGFGYISLGDLKSAQKSCEKAIEVALDPAYSEFPKISLGMAYFFGGQLQEAEKVFKSSLDFSEKHGMGQISLLGQCFLSPILIAKGHMKQGAELLEKARKTMIKNQRRVWYALSEHILGEVNLQIATGPKPALSIMAKNVGFLVKSVPFATKKAEEHFNKAIELLKGIGANGFLGHTYLSLGLLYKSSKRTDQAKQCILEAINVFQECAAETNLKQANETLDSLE